MFFGTLDINNLKIMETFLVAVKFYFKNNRHKKSRRVDYITSMNS